MTDFPTTTTIPTPTSVSQDYTQLQDTPEISTAPSSTSRRSLKKSNSMSKRMRKIVVFASASKYEWLVALLLVVPLVAILLSIILFDVQSQEEYKNSSTIWGLSWLFIFFIVLYMAVLPRQVDVRSDGGVAVKTCLLTFHLDEICSVTRGVVSSWDLVKQGGVLLATSLDKDGAVVIRRHGERWDAVVTPEDPEGFCAALEKMLRKKEEESDNNFVPAVVEPRTNSSKAALTI